eukprot:6198081-Pleurochrysis_carterae.AAC.1
MWTESLVRGREVGFSAASDPGAVHTEICAPSHPSVYFPHHSFSWPSSSSAARMPCAPCFLLRLVCEEHALRLALWLRRRLAQLEHEVLYGGDGRAAPR